MSEQKKHRSFADRKKAKERVMESDFNDFTYEEKLQKKLKQ